MTVTPFWSVLKKDYQVTLQINEGSKEPPVDFPLVLEPRKEHSKEEIIHEVSKLAAQSTDTDEQSVIRQLLDSHGGAVHLKGLALKNADEFSEFLDGLAGKGKHAWVPHEHIGMEVLRRPHAKNVLNTNEYILQSSVPSKSTRPLLIRIIEAHQATLSVGITNMPSLQPTLATLSSFAKRLPGLEERLQSSVRWHCTTA